MLRMGFAEADITPDRPVEPGSWRNTHRSADNMRAEEYLKDPCGASSLPFWKTEQLTFPQGVSVIRDDLYAAEQHGGTEEPYFKMIHRLEKIRTPELPAPFRTVACGPEGFADHIRECYTGEGITADELRACARRPVYTPDLWIAVEDETNGRIAASGIADLDARTGEGILEWIQVSPDYRRRGLGRFTVLELLRRMRGRAAFATVSGRVNNPDNPYALYRGCGFTDPVIWHVIRE